MALKRVEERLSRLANIVEKWNKSGDVPRIERDMALEELRHLYDELLDYNPQHEAKPAVEAVVPVVEQKAEAAVAEESCVVVEPSAESVSEEVVEVDAPAVVAVHEDLGDAFDDALDIDALLGLSGEDSIEEAEAALSVEDEVVEPITPVELIEPTETIATTEPEVEEQPIVEEPIVEEPAVEEPAVEEPAESKAEEVVEVAAVVEEQPAERPAGGGLFDIDDIPVRAKRGRKMISLYDAPIKPSAPVEEVASEPDEDIVVITNSVEPTPEPAPVPKPAPRPIPAPAPREEVPQRLGDVIAKGVTTLADKMAEEQPTAPFNRITDIRKAIGLNDKFLMIRDLFGGDVNLYEDTINHLNEFDDLDECMIFIVENFRWNPDSEGAKLLVSLLERKLS
ncbi:MAG: hypothetical protein IKW31_03170 [Alistipes sp.]|nr:hypothetical protein [Alistipes sp.]